MGADGETVLQCGRMPVIGYVSVGLLLLAVLLGFYDAEKGKYTSTGWLGVAGIVALGVVALLATSR